MQLPHPNAYLGVQMPGDTRVSVLVRIAYLLIGLNQLLALAKFYFLSMQARYTVPGCESTPGNKV